METQSCTTKILNSGHTFAVTNWFPKARCHTTYSSLQKLSCQETNEVASAHEAMDLVQ